MSFFRNAKKPIAWLLTAVMAFGAFPLQVFGNAIDAVQVTGLPGALMAEADRPMPTVLAVPTTDVDFVAANPVVWLSSDAVDGTFTVPAHATEFTAGDFYQVTIVLETDPQYGFETVGATQDFPPAGLTLTPAVTGVAGSPATLVSAEVSGNDDEILTIVIGWVAAAADNGLNAAWAAVHAAVLAANVEGGAIVVAEGTDFSEPGNLARTALNAALLAIAQEEYTGVTAVAVTGGGYEEGPFNPDGRFTSVTGNQITVAMTPAPGAATPVHPYVVPVGGFIYVIEADNGDEEDERINLRPGFPYTLGLSVVNVLGVPNNTAFFGPNAVEGQTVPLSAGLIGGTRTVLTTPLEVAGSWTLAGAQPGVGRFHNAVTNLSPAPQLTVAVPSWLISQVGAAMLDEDGEIFTDAQGDVDQDEFGDLAFYRSFVWLQLGGAQFDSASLGFWNAGGAANVVNPQSAVGWTSGHLIRGWSGNAPWAGQAPVTDFVSALNPAVTIPAGALEGVTFRGITPPAAPGTGLAPLTAAAGGHRNVYQHVNGHWTLWQVEANAAILQINHGDIFADPERVEIGGNVVLQIPLLARTTTADAATITVNSALGDTITNVNITTAMPITAAAVNPIEFEVLNTITHRSRLTFDLRVHERAPGGFRSLEGEWIELVAPAGFLWSAVNFIEGDILNSEPTDWRFGSRFGGNNIGTDRFSASPTVSVNETHFRLYNVQTNNRVLRIRFENNILPSELPGGHFTLNGFVLTAENPGVSREADGQIRAGIQHRRHAAIVGGFDGIFPATPNPGRFPTQDVNFGTISDWLVRMEVIGDVPELLSGRLLDPIVGQATVEEHRTARVRVTEIVPNSWHEDRGIEFSVPEGVRIREVVFGGVENIVAGDRDNILRLGTTDFARQMDGSGHHNYGRLGLSGAGSPDSIIINHDTLTVQRLRRTDRDDAIEFEMYLFLSIEPGFEGDIELSLGGRGANNPEDTPYVVIAEAISPIRVEADLTNVIPGDQFIPVGNFRIIENVPGALVEGGFIWLNIYDGVAGWMMIAPGFSMSVVEGDLGLGPAELPTPQAGIVPGERDWNMQVEVTAASTEASVIEFTDVVLQVAPIAPDWTRGFDLLVWGSAVAQNNANVNPGTWAAFSTAAVRGDMVNPRDLFPTRGFSELYVTTGVRGIPINDQVITFSADTITVGGTVTGLDTGVWGGFEVGPDGVGRIPARLAFALLFDSSGVPVEVFAHNPEIFVWNAATSTFHIDPGGRNIAFTTGSSMMIVGGTPRQIMSGEGAAAFAAASIVNPETSRLMLPIRAFADALGMGVAWDAETATVTLTPPSAE